MIKICEIFKSIQGESTYTGLLCTFIRLSGCNLNCSYCDTKYAFENGSEYSIEEILKYVKGHRCSLVEITGGEPLIQSKTVTLCQNLLQNNYTVLLETNGSLDISPLPSECIKIIDIKCPDSGSGSSFLLKNLQYLSQNDECKMVISTKNDFIWALDFVNKYSLNKKCSVLFSPNTRLINPVDLADWIIESDAPVRLGLQLHKIIWGENARGK
jgi:7-carboxy-7-deazaguanine synthase